MEAIFGKVIHSYTRADMMKDGELIDVTKTAKEAGFKVPVAITRAVYDGYILPSQKDKDYGQDEEGRLWDTIHMLRVGIRTSNNSTVVNFPVYYVMNGDTQIKPLKALSHPGDNGEHVITIMLPEED